MIGYSTLFSRQRIPTRVVRRLCQDERMVKTAQQHTTFRHDSNLMARCSHSVLDPIMVVSNASQRMNSKKLVIGQDVFARPIRLPVISLASERPTRRQTDRDRMRRGRISSVLLVHVKFPIARSGMPKNAK